MVDLISRAAALEAISNEGGCGMCTRRVLDIPAVDAVPVVRCRDCRYWRQEVLPTEHWVCAHHSFNERKMYTTPVFYCADGERRDGE